MFLLCLIMPVCPPYSGLNQPFQQLKHTKTYDMGAANSELLRISVFRPRTQLRMPNPPKPQKRLPKTPVPPTQLRDRLHFQENSPSHLERLPPLHQPFRCLRKRGPYWYKLQPFIQRSNGPLVIGVAPSTNHRAIQPRAPGIDPPKPSNSRIAGVLPFDIDNPRLIPIPVPQLDLVHPAVRILAKALIPPRATLDFQSGHWRLKLDEARLGVDGIDANLCTVAVDARGVDGDQTGVPLFGRHAVRVVVAQAGRHGGTVIAAGHQVGAETGAAGQFSPRRRGHPRNEGADVMLDTGVADLVVGRVEIDSLDEEGLVAAVGGEGEGCEVVDERGCEYHEQQDGYVVGNAMDKGGEREEQQSGKHGNDHVRKEEAAAIRAGLVDSVREHQADLGGEDDGHGTDQQELEEPCPRR